MSSTVTEHRQAQTGATQRWIVDPGRTVVEFEVKNLWGLAAVAGHFDRFDGTYTVSPDQSAIDLTIDAASVDTGIGLRDKHLRSPDFFDASEFPKVRFASTRMVDMGDGRVHVSGDLEAAGTPAPIAFEATVRDLDDELEFEMTTTVDQGRFGMSSGPLRNIRPPAKLHVKARLVTQPLRKTADAAPHTGV